MANAPVKMARSWKLLERLHPSQTPASAAISVNSTAP
ncbi:hypothetical protein L914_14805, partial [Phytophthora nicotianae]